MSCTKEEKESLKAKATLANGQLKEKNREVEKYEAEAKKTRRVWKERNKYTVGLEEGSYDAAVSDRNNILERVDGLKKEVNY